MYGLSGNPFLNINVTGSFFDRIIGDRIIKKLIYSGC